MITALLGGTYYDGCCSFIALGRLELPITKPWRMSDLVKGDWLKDYQTTSMRDLTAIANDKSKNNSDKHWSELDSSRDVTPC